jgi:hypothetical protein
VYLKIILIALAITFQASCSGSLGYLASKENKIRSRGDFNSFLALEYLEYSRDLANKHNSRDSKYFAKKGLRAYKNKPVDPEIPANWYLDPNDIGEAQKNRERLENLVTPEVKKTLPIQSAHLIMLYDCWITKARDPWQLTDMSKCKARFNDLTDEMEQYLAGLAPQPQIREIETLPPEFVKFDVYFDLDSYKFNEKANGEFLQLMDHLKKLNGDYTILLVGAADRSGSELYNDSLARKRVLVAKDQLIKNGVPADSIEVNSMGESNPQIITKDDKQNKYNRRVSVYVLKGRDSLSTIPLPLIDNYIYKKEIGEAKKEVGVK